MAEWVLTDYQNNARDVFAAMPKNDGTAAVISFGRNGGTPVAKQYRTSEEASAAYDAVVNAPTDRYYVALFDTVKSAVPSGSVDETYFGPLTPMVSVKKVRVPVAMGAIAAFGILALLAKVK